MLFLSENQIFIGGIGLGSQQLTTVEFYNIASDTWRISSTATVSPETIFFAHVDAGDFYALHGNLVLRYDEGTEVFNALNNLVINPIHDLHQARIVTVVPGTRADCRPP